MVVVTVVKEQCSSSIKPEQTQPRTERKEIRNKKQESRARARTRTRTEHETTRQKRSEKREEMGDLIRGRWWLVHWRCSRRDKSGRGGRSVTYGTVLVEVHVLV